MFTHEFLEKLADMTCAIYRRNAAGQAEVFGKGRNGQDVVTGTDLDNERMLRALLKKDVPGLAFIYGEENGYEQVSGSGSGGALIDPVDGTRAFAAGVFYSCISVAFADAAGKTTAGYLIRINNQASDDLAVWTYDGESVRKDGEPYRPGPQIESVSQAWISVTNIAGLPENDRALSAIIFKLLADRSRGPVSLCSGAAEAISVIEGRLGGLINMTRRDIVSHPVAVEIAKCLGFYVRHVFSADADFRVAVDPENADVRPAGDVSVVIAPMPIKDEIDALLRDAAEIYEKAGDLL